MIKEHVHAQKPYHMVQHLTKIYYCLLMIDIYILTTAMQLKYHKLE